MTSIDTIDLTLDDENDTGELNVEQSNPARLSLKRKMKTKKGKIISKDRTISKDVIVIDSDSEIVSTQP
jgi:archaellum biogenesis ATPase FlaH